MESLGEKLRNAREERGLSLDQVSRDTNIAARYIEGMETEIFTDFPGEPYVIGFLRNYGTYLELDVQELHSLYRALKIQEQPVPQQLLKGPSPLPKIAKTVAIVLLAMGAAGGGTLLIRNIIVNRPPPPQPVMRQVSEYTMDNDSVERRFYQGDTILIPIENDKYKLELASLDDTLIVRTPSGYERIELGQSVEVDLTKNGVSDVQITAADFDKKKPDMGALIRIDMMDALAMQGLTQGVAQTAATTPIEVSTGTIPTSSTEIFASPNAYPFTLQSNFQGYCMFRWEILFERDRRDRNEKYFQRADELNIQAQNGIRIWTSNAQAAKFQVIGGGRTVPLELGAAGEVVVADIRWVRGEDNRFRLILVRLENTNA